MKNVFETLKELENEIKPLEEYEIISLENACKRILTEDIYAQKNLPSFDNAALDGYAFNYDDINEPLSVKGSILAGDKNAYELGKNETFRIMTGAIMPKNADTILMIEDEFLQNEKLIIKNPPKRYNAYRFKGEEVKFGELLLKKGLKIKPSHIALLASQGIYKIKVARKLSVGIFSSGNELYEPWQNCDEKSIYNANALPLMTMFENTTYLGIIKDDFESTKKALKSPGYDILISSGGASVGEADFMQKALFELGFKPIFTGLKARPAKPTKLFKRGQNLVLILPGNPMSAFLSAFVFGKKILNLLSGNLEIPISFEAKMGMDLKLKGGRNNFVLGNLQDEIFMPFNENKFGSGMILPLVNSNFLFISDENSTQIKKGDKIKILKLWKFS